VREGGEVILGVEEMGIWLTKEEGRKFYWGGVKLHCGAWKTVESLSYSKD